MVVGVHCRGVEVLDPARVAFLNLNLGPLLENVPKPIAWRSDVKAYPRPTVRIQQEAGAPSHAIVVVADIAIA